MSSYRKEPLTGQMHVYVSENHRFGTDAFLLANFSNWRKKDLVCDLGTGCGIIPMILQRKNPPKHTWGVDIQADAIDQFLQAITECGVQDRVTPVCADLKQLWQDAPLERCDLVTCNPPYKAYQAGMESQLTAQKIARHEILCNIADVCQAASRLLKFGGRLCICNRSERLADCIAAMQQFHIEPKRLQFVSKNPDTAPWLFLLEGRKGGKPFLNVLPQFYIRDGETDSEAVRNLYRLPEEQEVQP